MMTLILDIILRIGVISFHKNHLFQYDVIFIRLKLQIKIYKMLVLPIVFSNEFFFRIYHTHLIEIA